MARTRSLIGASSSSRATSAHTLVWVRVVVPRRAAHLPNGIAESIVDITRLILPHLCGPVLRSLPCGVPAVPFPAEAVRFLGRERAPFPALRCPDVCEPSFDGGVPFTGLRSRHRCRPWPGVEPVFSTLPVQARVLRDALAGGEAAFCRRGKLESYTGHM